MSGPVPGAGEPVAHIVIDHQRGDGETLCLPDEWVEHTRKFEGFTVRDLYTADQLTDGEAAAVHLLRDRAGKALQVAPALVGRAATR